MADETHREPQSVGTGSVEGVEWLIGLLGGGGFVVIIYFSGDVVFIFPDSRVAQNHNRSLEFVMLLFGCSFDHLEASPKHGSLEKMCLGTGCGVQPFQHQWVKDTQYLEMP